MSAENQSAFEAIGETLSYSFIEGGFRVPHTPHLTPWRDLPFSVVVYVHCGRYFYHPEEDERQTVPPGCTLVIPQGMIHKVEMEGDGCLSVLHICYSLAHKMDVFSLFAVPRLLYGQESEAMSALLCDFYKWRSLSGQDIGAAIQQRLAAFEILQNVLRLSVPKEDVSRRLLKINHVSAALQYINDNLAGDLSRERLARLLALSETRFHYVFKEATGLSPMKYVSNQRLTSARMLLLTTSEPVADIAARTGYEDLYHFSKMFKQQFGMSPSGYRKSARPVAAGRS